MAVLKRLLTYADVGDDPSRPTRVNVVLRHEVELEDGRRILLLADRGWGGEEWTDTSAENIRSTSRMVVGPDAPPAGRSEEDMQNIHWHSLKEIAQSQGVTVDASELKRLPHDVMLSQRLLARLDDPRPSSY